MASGEASLEGPLVDEENLVVAARAVPDGELRAFAEDLAERFQRLQRLQAVTNYIAEAETASALEQIIDAAHAVLSADRVTLFTVDHKRQRLCLALSNAASAEGKVIPMSEGIVGACAMTGMVINSPDAYADARFNPWMDQTTGYRTRSVLCLPVFEEQGAVIAVLQASNKIRADGSVGAFDEFDEHLLECIGITAGNALYKLGLYEEARRAEIRNAMLLALTKILAGEVSLERMVAVVVYGLRTLVRASVVNFFLVDEHARQLWLVQAPDDRSLEELVRRLMQEALQTASSSSTAEGSDPDARRLQSFLQTRRTQNFIACREAVPLDRGIVGLVARTGRTVVTQDASSHPAFDPVSDEQNAPPLDDEKVDSPDSPAALASRRAPLSNLRTVLQSGMHASSSSPSLIHIAGASGDDEERDAQGAAAAGDAGVHDRPIRALPAESSSSTELPSGLPVHEDAAGTVAPSASVTAATATATSGSAFTSTSSTIYTAHSSTTLSGSSNSSSGSGSSSSGSGAGVASSGGLGGFPSTYSIASTGSGAAGGGVGPGLVGTRRHRKYSHRSRVSSSVFVPLRDQEGRVLAVIQAMNKWDVDWRVRRAPVVRRHSTQAQPSSSLDFSAYSSSSSSSSAVPAPLSLSLSLSPLHSSPSSPSAPFVPPTISIAPSPTTMSSSSASSSSSSASSGAPESPLRSVLASELAIPSAATLLASATATATATPLSPVAKVASVPDLTDVSDTRSSGTGTSTFRVGAPSAPILAPPPAPGSRTNSGTATLPAVAPPSPLPYGSPASPLRPQSGSLTLGGNSTTATVGSRESVLSAGSDVGAGSGAAGNGGSTHVGMSGRPTPLPFRASSQASILSAATLGSSGGRSPRVGSVPGSGVVWRSARDTAVDPHAELASVLGSSAASALSLPTPTARGSLFLPGGATHADADAASLAGSGGPGSNHLLVPPSSASAGPIITTSFSSPAPAPMTGVGVSSPRLSPSTALPDGRVAGGLHSDSMASFTGITGLGSMASIFTVHGGRARRDSLGRNTSMPAFPIPSSPSTTPVHAAVPGLRPPSPLEAIEGATGAAGAEGMNARVGRRDPSKGGRRTSALSLPVQEFSDDEIDGNDNDDVDDDDDDDEDQLDEDDHAEVVVAESDADAAGIAKARVGGHRRDSGGSRTGTRSAQKDVHGEAGPSRPRRSSLETRNRRGSDPTAGDGEAAAGRPAHQHRLLGGRNAESMPPATMASVAATVVTADVAGNGGASATSGRTSTKGSVATPERKSSAGPQTPERKVSFGGSSGRPGAASGNGSWSPGTGLNPISVPLSTRGPSLSGSSSAGWPGSPSGFSDGSAGDSVVMVPFTDTDVRVMESLAASAAVCLQKALMFSDVLRAQRRTEALLQVVRASSQDADFIVVVEDIVRAIRSAVSADKVSLFIVDEGLQKLWCAVSDDLVGVDIPLGKGIAGQVAVTGEEVNLADAYRDARFNRQVDKSTHYRTQSLLCLPVRDQRQRIVAVVEALNKRPSSSSNATAALATATTTVPTGATGVATTAPASMTAVAGSLGLGAAVTATPLSTASLRPRPASGSSSPVAVTPFQATSANFSSSSATVTSPIPFVGASEVHSRESPGASTLTHAPTATASSGPATSSHTPSPRPQPRHPHHSHHVHPHQHHHPSAPESAIDAVSKTTSSTGSPTTAPGSVGRTDGVEPRGGGSSESPSSGHAALESDDSRGALGVSGPLPNRSRAAVAEHEHEHEHERELAEEASEMDGASPVLVDGNASLGLGSPLESPRSSHFFDDGDRSRSTTTHGGGSLHHENGSLPASSAALAAAASTTTDSSSTASTSQHALLTAAMGPGSASFSLGSHSSGRPPMLQASMRSMSFFFRHGTPNRSSEGSSPSLTTTTTATSSTTSSVAVSASTTMPSSASASAASSSVAASSMPSSTTSAATTTSTTPAATDPRATGIVGEETGSPALQRVERGASIASSADVVPRAATAGVPPSVAGVKPPSAPGAPSGSSPAGARSRSGASISPSLSSTLLPPTLIPSAAAGAAAASAVASPSGTGDRFIPFDEEDLAFMRACCFELAHALRRASWELIMVQLQHARGPFSSTAGMGGVGALSGEDPNNFLVGGAASVAAAAAAAAAAAHTTGAGSSKVMVPGLGAPRGGGSTFAAAVQASTSVAALGVPSAVSPPAPTLSSARTSASSSRRKNSMPSDDGAAPAGPPKGISRWATSAGTVSASSPGGALVGDARATSPGHGDKSTRRRARTIHGATVDALNQRLGSADSGAGLEFDSLADADEVSGGTASGAGGGSTAAAVDETGDSDGRVSLRRPPSAPLAGGSAPAASVPSRSRSRRARSQSRSGEDLLGVGGSSPSGPEVAMDETTRRVRMLDFISSYSHEVLTPLIPASQAAPPRVTSGGLTVASGRSRRGSVGSDPTGSRDGSAAGSAASSPPPPPPLFQPAAVASSSQARSMRSPSGSASRSDSRKSSPSVGVTIARTGTSPVAPSRRATVGRATSLNVDVDASELRGALRTAPAASASLLSFAAASGTSGTSLPAATGAAGAGLRPLETGVVGASVLSRPHHRRHPSHGSGRMPSMRHSNTLATAVQASLWSSSSTPSPVFRVDVLVLGGRRRADAASVRASAQAVADPFDVSAFWAASEQLRHGGSGDLGVASFVQPPLVREHRFLTLPPREPAGSERTLSDGSMGTNGTASTSAGASAGAGASNSGDRRTSASWHCDETAGMLVTLDQVRAFWSGVLGHSRIRNIRALERVMDQWTQEVTAQIAAGHGGRAHARFTKADLQRSLTTLLSLCEPWTAGAQRDARVGRHPSDDASLCDRSVSETGPVLPTNPFTDWSRQPSTASVTAASVADARSGGEDTEEDDLVDDSAGDSDEGDVLEHPVHHPSHHPVHHPSHRHGAPPSRVPSHHTLVSTHSHRRSPSDGSVTGSVTGSVVGSVVGSVTGSVVGSVADVDLGVLVGAVGIATTPPLQPPPDTAPVTSGASAASVGSAGSLGRENPTDLTESPLVDRPVLPALAISSSTHSMLSATTTASSAASQTPTSPQFSPLVAITPTALPADAASSAALANSASTTSTTSTQPMVSNGEQASSSSTESVASTTSPAPPTVRHRRPSVDVAHLATSMPSPPATTPTLDAVAIRSDVATVMGSDAVSSSSLPTMMAPGESAQASPPLGPLAAEPAPDSESLGPFSPESPASLEDEFDPAIVDEDDEADALADLEWGGKQRVPRRTPRTDGSAGGGGGGGRGGGDVDVEEPEDETDEVEEEPEDEDDEEDVDDGWIRRAENPSALSVLGGRGVLGSGVARVMYPVLNGSDDVGFRVRNDRLVPRGALRLGASSGPRARGGERGEWSKQEWAEIKPAIECDVYSLLSSSSTLSHSSSRLLRSRRAHRVEGTDEFVTDLDYFGLPAVPSSILDRKRAGAGGLDMRWLSARRKRSVVVGSKVARALRLPRSLFRTLGAPETRLPTWHPLAMPIARHEFDTWEFFAWTWTPERAGALVLRMLEAAGAASFRDPRCWAEDVDVASLQLENSRREDARASGLAAWVLAGCPPATPIGGEGVSGAAVAVPAAAAAAGAGAGAGAGATTTPGSSPSSSATAGGSSSSSSSSSSSPVTASPIPGSSASSSFASAPEGWVEPSYPLGADDVPFESKPILLHGPTVLAFVEAVRRRYRPNRFHNFVHGFHVCQATYKLIQDMRLRTVMSPLERASMILCALSHDVDHPGVSNDLLMKKGCFVARLYNDTSVLENHHSAMTAWILQQRGLDVLSVLETRLRRRARKVMISAILATDMSRHFDMADDVKRQQKPFAPGCAEKDRNKIADVVVHCADVSGQVTPWTTASEWSNRVVGEFQDQARREEAEGLERTTFMQNLHLPQVRSDLQSGFCNFVLLPLWQPLADLYPELQPRVQQLLSNARMHQSLGIPAPPPAAPALAPTSSVESVSEGNDELAMSASPSSSRGSQSEREDEEDEDEEDEDEEDEDEEDEDEDEDESSTGR